MPWDVSKPVAEVNHDFEKAIPKEAKTWVRIDKVRPGANAIMEATLSDATLVYRAGEVQQRIQQHGTVAVGEHETVAVGPQRVGRVVLEVAIP